MLFAQRDSGLTSGVGTMEMTESERRIADVVKYGTVTEVDYSDATNPVVRVGIGDPADADGYFETDWIPMGANRSNEWDPLQVGEQVQVHAEAGELQNAMVGRVMHSSANPAASTRADLYQKTFPNGAMIQYDYASGEMKLVAATRVTVIASKGVNFEAEVNVQGSLSATGNLTAGTGASGKFTTADGLTVTVQDGVITNIF